MSPSKLKYVILCFLITRIQNALGLRCMECSDLPNPVDCNRITTCGQSEQCYVDQYVTSSGIVLFSSGCRSQFRCAAPVGKKRFLMSSTDILTCSQCCNNAEFCNIEGCGVKAPQIPQRGLFCFQCDAQSSPDTCRDVVTCDAGNACVVSKVATGPQIYYQSGCIEENACVSIEKVAAMVGRRRQTIEQCPVCCRTDFCNDNCDRNTTVLSLLSPLTTTSISPHWTSSTVRSTMKTAYLTTISSQNTSLGSSFVTSRPTGHITTKNFHTLAPNSTVSSSKATGYLTTKSSQISNLVSTVVPSNTSGHVTIKSSQNPNLNSTISSTKTIGYVTTKSSQSVTSRTSALPTKKSSQTPSSNITVSSTQTTNNLHTPKSVSSAVPSKATGFVTTNRSPTSKTTGHVTVKSSLTPSQNSIVGFTKTSVHLTTKYSQLVTSNNTGHVTIKSTQTPTTKRTIDSTIAGAHSSTKGLHVTTAKSTTTTKPPNVWSSVSSFSHPTTHRNSYSHWGQWTHWSKCNCNDITQTRHRHCFKHHNKDCPGTSEEHMTCSGFSKCHVSSQNCNMSAGYVLKHTHHDTMCLKLYWKLGTWGHAQQQCHKDDPHGHLVVINTPEREKGLEEYLNHLHGHTRLSTMWIGLNFRNGHWHWSNGAHTVGNRYTQTFFNTHKNPSQHCAGKLSSGGWSTFSCFEEHIFVCEIR